MFKLYAMKNNNFKRVLIFYTIAIIFSNIFRFDLFGLNSHLKQLSVPLSLTLRVILEGSGVLIGALIALYLFKKSNKPNISFFGESKHKTLFMSSIPLFLIIIIGVDNNYDVNPHLYGVLVSFVTLLYCIMEEYGWRGYLQEEFRGMKIWSKYLFIGILWYLWHLSFLQETSLTDNIFFLFMIIIGSAGIGKVSEFTKSILACASFHLVIQILMYNTLIKNGITGIEKIIILGVSIIVWFLIIKRWEKEKNRVIN